jgi:hypothetical protein
VNNSWGPRNIINKVNLYITVHIRTSSRGLVVKKNAIDVLLDLKVKMKCCTWKELIEKLHRDK